MSTTNRPVATVERAIAVLHTLAGASGDLGNNEIARRTGINVSSVSRLLATLANDELVSRVAESGRFRLGPRLVELGNAALARVDIRQLCRPHLVALTEATGETATLSVPYEEGTITVDFVQSPSSVRSVAQVGRPSIAHATATGKVFLAYAGTMPAGPLPSYTRRTVTDVAALEAEVAQIRHRGWAQAVGEREDDLNALAAPVRGAGAVLTAVLGLQGPGSRFGPKAMRAAVQELTAHCAQLEWRGT
ncbi:MAG TPA: IclR family transcriptional regulator [Nocardioidaceae bacterium]|nr:IclR family transcriptional regulator [Nocardioidaceae bacterium]